MKSYRLWLNIGCGIAVGFILMACARDREPMTQADLDFSFQENVAMTECYKARSAEAVADFEVLANLPPDTLEKIMLLKHQNDTMMAIVAMVTGADINPCDDGANYYDLEIEATKADALLKKSYVDGGLSALSTGIMWGAGAWGVSELVGAVGSTYNAFDSSRINTGTNVDSQNGTTADTTDEGGGTDPPIGTCDQEKYNQCVEWWPGGEADNGCSCNSYCLGHCAISVP